MNSLEQYISDLNPSCWYRSDTTNGYGIANPANGDNITNFKNIAQSGVFDGVFDIVGSNPPKYMEGGVNGLPYLEFLASNNTLRIPTPTSPYGISERTVVLVVSNNDGSFNTIFQHDFGGIVNGNLGIQGFLRVGTYQSNLGVSFDKQFIRPIKIIITSQKNGGLYNLYDTNTRYDFAKVECIANPSNLDVAYRGITIGVRINSGTGVPNSPYTSFRFYEMLIFDKQLSPNQVQTYLKLKYNI